MTNALVGYEFTQLQQSTDLCIHILFLGAPFFSKSRRRFTLNCHVLANMLTSLNHVLSLFCVNGGQNEDHIMPH